MTPSLKQVQLFSQHLEEERTLTIYLPDKPKACRDLPVLICADGQTIKYFAAKVHTEIEAHRCPLVVLVGIHSHPDTRDFDYVLGFHQHRYEAHERFVLEEVLPFIRKTMNLKLSNKTCGVFGYSNGAVFAHTIAVRHPETFGFSIVFSAADKRIDRSGYPPGLKTAFYLASGTIDEPCQKMTLAIAKDLELLGVSWTYSEEVAGHELSFWVAELPQALQWVLDR